MEGLFMNKFIKYVYIILTAVFLLLTAYEIFVYMKLDSNYVGIIYLFFNFFIMFLLFSTCYNYEKGNIGIRISKNMIAIGLGVFTSFILSLVLPYIFKYSDSSFLFSDGIFVVSKILKPIVYVMLGVVSVLELKPNLLKRNG